MTKSFPNFTFERNNDGRKKVTKQLANSKKLLESILPSMATKLLYWMKLLSEQITRGAVYHHIWSKNGFFLAVLKSVQPDVAEKVESEAAQSEDVWCQLILSCRAFVTAAVEDNNKRIMLIDGPAVLGWETWRNIDEQGSMRLFHEQLQLMQKQGYFESVSIDALTHILSGALNESALRIAQMPNLVESVEETMKIISQLFERFRS